MHAYRHHLGDYAKDTSGLTQGQHGAYRLLIDACYSSESGLDPDEIYTISRAASPDERRNCDKVLRKFFYLGEDGKHHQKRIEAEIAAYLVKAQTNREVGKRGGRPSKTGPPGNPQETITVSGEEPKPNPPETLASSHKPLTPPSLRSGGSRARKPRVAMPEGFGISSRVIEWAKAEGHDRLEEHLDAFRLKCAAGGYAYADWDSAFMGAIREDWAGLRTPAGKAQNGRPVDRWWESEQGMAAKARSLNIPGPKVGETSAAFRARINQAMGT